jgi:16S rRNA U1498 N3-methylase RsmE
MGFQTFNSVINEDYDNMTGKNKVKHVVDAAIELCKIYNTPEVLEICQFNRELYLNHQFRKEVCKKLFFDKLEEIVKKSHPSSLI